MLFLAQRTTKRSALSSCNTAMPTPALSTSASAAHWATCADRLPRLSGRRPIMGVYAQTAENSVPLADHVACPGADAVVLFMADRSVSENTRSAVSVCYTIPAGFSVRISVRCGDHIVMGYWPVAIQVFPDTLAQRARQKIWGLGVHPQARYEHRVWPTMSDRRPAYAAPTALCSLPCSRGRRQRDVPLLCHSIQRRARLNGCRGPSVPEPGERDRPGRA